MRDAVTLALPGCTPSSLMGYLKGTAVLRLVSQEEPAARSGWPRDLCQLRSPLDVDGLVDFFLDRYEPTPIVSPWNAGSGFWDDKAAGQALRALDTSTHPRLLRYRRTIEQTRQVIEQLGITRKQLEDKEQKARLLRSLRSTLPEDALDWLDAAASVTDVPHYAPLLGTGGNDGRLDFSANFMQRLAAVLPLGSLAADGRASFDRDRSSAWLRSALFDEGSPPLVPAALGQFHPGGIGGPNATSGFEGDSLVNPWDFILLLEGTMSLAGAVARRLGSDSNSRAEFPFTVATTVAGYETLASEEATRAEIWLPLWERFASYDEVRLLFAEGRAQVGRRQARSGLDFARSLAGLGVDRGISGFERFGFVQRNGLNFLATSLGRYAVQARADVRLIDQVDGWIARLRGMAGSDSPAALGSALRAIEDAVFNYYTAGTPALLQKVLVALGAAERVVAARTRVGDEARDVWPLQGLTADWLGACDDGSAEFHLAASLASIHHDVIGPLREQIEPVRRARDGGFAWSGEQTPVPARGRDLTRLLEAILERRLLEARRQGVEGCPTAGRFGASLAEVHLFLIGATDDERLLNLVFALGALRWRESDARSRRVAAPADLSRAYAVLKLLFLPKPLRVGHDSARDMPVSPDPAILPRLRSGQIDSAVLLAQQRLFARGFAPLGRPTALTPTPQRFIGPVDGERLAAALLFPISDSGATALARMALREQSSEQAAQKG